MVSSYTEDEAYSHILTTFKQVWEDEVKGWKSVEDLDSEPYIQYSNTRDERLQETQSEPQDESPWLKIYWRPQDSDHRAIGALSGSPLFEESGLLVIDIYVPVKTGLKLAHQLSTVCKRPFKGKRGYGDGCGITFPRVRAPERGVERGKWYVKSVLVDYEFDEVI